MSILALTSHHLCMARNYPEFMDRILYPLGYSKNVLDSDFDDFKAYAKRHYNCRKTYMDGFEVTSNANILNIDFAYLSCISFSHKGPTFTFATDKSYSRYAYENLIKLLKSNGLTEKDAGEPNSLNLYYNDILEFNVNFIPESGRIELFVAKEKPNTFTHLSKYASSQTPASEDIKVQYSFVSKGKLDNSGNVDEDKLSAINKTYGYLLIYGPESGNHVVQLILEDTKGELNQVFMEEIVGVDCTEISGDDIFGIDWSESSITICTPKHKLLISKDVCYVANANNCTLIPNGDAWELSNSSLFPIISYSISESLDKLYHYCPLKMDGVKN